MSKSAIYTVNSGVAVAAGGIIPLGTIERRYGKCVTLNGNGIALLESGYYEASVSATVEPTAAGTVTVILLRDGVAVPGGTASANAAAAGNPVALSFTSIIRDCCPCAGTVLTVELVEGAGVVTNIAVAVEKL